MRHTSGILINDVQMNFDWTVEPNLRAFLQTVRNARNAESGLVQELFDLLDRMSRRTREGYNTFSAVPPDVKMLKPLMPKGMPRFWMFFFLLLCRDLTPPSSQI